jgi:uncharacterized protein YbjT (DUF2867 family)
MRRILVTGGSGGLGRLLVEQLVMAGKSVRVMSRSQRTAGQQGSEWAQADLLSGAGLAEAVADVHTIIHAASLPSGPTHEVDVLGTERLLTQARTAGVAHIIYVSIVGVEHIPLAYYRHKLAAEQLVERGGLPWSIQRATQFHTLLDGLLRKAARLPIMPLPTDLQFQPIDTGDAARHICGLVEAGPGGRLPDIGGPEVLRLGDLARSWRAAHGLRRPILHLPLPGGVAHALRRGYNTCPAQRTGQISWAGWLAQQVGHTATAEPPRARRV